MEESSNNAESICVLALNKRSWQHSKAGGSELNLEETLKRLGKRGHQVHLLTGSDEGKSRTDYDESVSIRRIGFDDRFPAPWDVVISYITISIYFYYHLYRISPDVIYTVNTPLPWPVLTRHPRVSIFHHIAIDSFFDTHPFPQNILGFVSQWFGVFQERNNPTVSVSPSTTEELISRGHDPNTVYEIRNGLSLKKYKPGTESNKPRIVYVGGLERYKGVDRIPEIHQAIQEKMRSPVHLDVAGRDGPVQEIIEKYCEEFDEANYHGFVTEEKKLDLLQSAWIFIAPSRVEGWGIAVLEANACGTPAVGSDVNGLRDSIRDGETGLLAKGSDPELFASKIKHILIESERRSEFAEQARSWAELHSWEESVNQLEKLFLLVSTGDD
ncbi:glycosyltransferase family 4 protein [Haladaptatus sp. DFWS20]|uniref:glycosyltransferase family 4 protein n=1 Tax=Haladaptatus sp. DFWS20 TaxID=3403467 RepID=UPI003EC0FE41